MTAAHLERTMSTPAASCDEDFMDLHWRLPPGWRDASKQYEISRDGKIIREKTTHEELPIMERAGEFYTAFNQRIWQIARLVYFAFYTNQSIAWEHYVVIHKDGDKKNNCIDNLILVAKDAVEGEERKMTTTAGEEKKKKPRKRKAAEVGGVTQKEMVKKPKKTKAKVKEEQQVVEKEQKEKKPRKPLTDEQKAKKALLAKERRNLKKALASAQMQALRETLKEDLGEGVVSILEVA